mgnify:CR=1 FL=1
MSYIKDNKAAWEEAFEHRLENWGDDNHKRLLNETLPFFDANVAAELQKLDFAGKTVAQFCCNNGRELLSLMQLGAKAGVGFDIAENIIGQARETAQLAHIDNCTFVACNILEIPQQYDGAFDFILFTIGAITWFEDLGPLFQKVAMCLKPGGMMLIHDFHPFMNMLPTPEEDAFDAGRLDKLAYSYFRSEPWIENTGMAYMSKQYTSKTFTSFSHTMASIVNAASAAGLRVFRLNEYDYDVGLTAVYDGKGYPLSFLLLAEKIG